MDIFDALPFLSFLALAGILTGRILTLLKKGIQISSKNGKRNKATMFLFPVFGLIFLVWLFEITKPAFQISFSVLPEMLTNRLIQSSLMKITGAVLIFLAMLVLTITLVHLNTSLRFGLDEKNQGKLVTTGIFSVSRNPFFLSLDFYFPGIALIFPSLFFIGFAVLAIVSIHFFILKEEKFLGKVYGKEYEKYSGRTKRYF
jgi:protein-S-isoprenylcysteine O-methyltransferase Ste14